MSAANTGISTNTSGTIAIQAQPPVAAKTTSKSWYFLKGARQYTVAECEQIRNAQAEILRTKLKTHWQWTANAVIVFVSSPLAAVLDSDARANINAVNLNTVNSTPRSSIDHAGSSRSASESEDDDICPLRAQT